MYNYVKRSFMFISIVAILTFIVLQVNANNVSHEFEYNYQPPLFGNEIYLSNRYTQPDDDRLVSGDQTIPTEFKEIAKKGDLILYFNEDSFEFKVKNIKTGYVWNSAAQNTKESGLNATNRELMRSPVIVEYFQYVEKTNVTATTTKRASAFDAKISYFEIENGIVAHLNYSKLDIQFDVEITLEENGLVVFINHDSIYEEKNKIASIHVFSNFGSTFKDETPGYMFIPDGPGTLYRFKDNSAQNFVVQFSAQLFGEDKGIKNNNDTNRLLNFSMPVYGMVHGVNQNAFLAIIEEGLYNATLNINPSGANDNNYNFIGPQFILREPYVYPTNLKGAGITVLQEEINDENMKVRFLFTEKAESNYVGMARLYQTYLVSNGILKQHVSTPKLRLEILQIDSEKGLFGPKTLKMTNINESEEMINRLYSNGVTEMFVVLRGWNKNGLSGESPYELKYDNKLGSIKEINRFINELNAKDLDLFFYNDYIKSFETSNVVNPKTDFAKGIYKRHLTTMNGSPMYPTVNYLNPTTSLEILQQDLNKYDKLNIDSVAIDTIGNALYTTLQNDVVYNRKQNASIYQELVSTLRNYKNLSLYKPNAYLWEYTQDYLDVPMYNTQLNLYDDTVPFLQIVLRGYMDYYSPFMNYLSNPVEQKLMMIDYGIYPSYIVTKEPTYKLKYTSANHFYSTEFNVWENEIIKNYREIAETLKPVSGEKIAKRMVIGTGVVEVTYTNGIKYIINYSDEDFTYQNVLIQAKTYLKVGG